MAHVSPGPAHPRRATLAISAASALLLVVGIASSARSGVRAVRAVRAPTVSIDEAASGIGAAASGTGVPTHSSGERTTERFAEIASVDLEMHDPEPLIDGNVGINGDRFRPGSLISIELHSAPKGNEARLDSVPVASAVADASGAFRAQVAVATTLGAAHELWAVGTTTEGIRRTEITPVLVP